MAKIFVRYGFTGINGVVVVTWNSMENPSAEIGRQVVDGVNMPFNGGFTIHGLEPIMHEVHFYESTDSVTLQVPLMKLDIDAALETENSVQIYHYKVGRGEVETDPAKPYWADPADGDESLIDERLAGGTYENMVVNMQGIGDLHPEQFDIIPAGGITLKDTIFTQDGRFSVKFHSSKPVIAVVEKVVLREPITLITNATETFKEEHYAKNNIAVFNDLIAYLDVGDFAAIPDGTYAIFSTYSMGSRYWVIRFTSQLVFFMNKWRAEIILGRNERLVLGWQGGAGYVLDYDGDYAFVGQKTNGDTEHNNTFRVATKNADLYHTEYEIEHFRRLLTELPAEQKVSYADWDTYQDDNPYVASNPQRYYYNRGKYAVDEAAGRFKFPALAELYMKFVKSDENIGRLGSGLTSSLQKQRLLRHGHRLLDGQGGSSTGTIVGTGLSGQDAKKPNGLYYDESQLEPTGDNKQEVDNFGQYLYIRI